MKKSEQLKNNLFEIDSKSYKAYKSVKGKYSFKNYTLCIDYVQGDPYASPSKVRVIVPQKFANIPSEYFDSRIRNIALCDYLTRNIYKNIRKFSKGRRGSGKSGMFYIDKGNQEVLQRSSIKVDGSKVELRFSIGMPAKGRKILGRQAYYMLFKDLPKIVTHSVFQKNISQRKISKHIETVEDAQYIRENLSSKSLVTFIKNGSILPRRSGIDPRPMKKDAVPFKSPPSLEVEFFVPNHGRITGMGIPEGVTLIVGGGYHGKSTLLNAIQLGVYNHIPGDGRESVVTNENAVKIRSEDGRRVEKVNISSFIDHLPSHINSKSFSTVNASGSTSQAANIMESLEIGTSLLLIDEDTSATNFMIRDYRMQQLVPFKKEPITPFIDRVEELYQKFGTSTILVMGGAGDYFDTADRVIMMDSYHPHDVTNKVKKIVSKNKSKRKKENKTGFNVPKRKIDSNTVNPYRKHKVKIKIRGKNKIQFGNSNIDLSGLEQLVDRGQTKLIGDCLYYLAKKYLKKGLNLKEAVEQLYREIITRGLDNIVGSRRGYINNYALTRKYEIAAALNRLRTMKVIK